MPHCDVQRRSPVENIPGIANVIPGVGRKPFAFPPESLFAFSPESRSSSPRKSFRVHPGIAFAFAPESASLLAAAWTGETSARRWTSSSARWPCRHPQGFGSDESLECIKSFDSMKEGTFDDSVNLQGHTRNASIMQGVFPGKIRSVQRNDPVTPFSRTQSMLCTRSPPGRPS